MVNSDPLLTAGISVVVPVYNSEGTIQQLVARLEPVLLGLTGKFEVILVNDGSRDGSWAAIQRCAQSHPWVRGIDLMRNHGQHNALLCGIREARLDKILTIDDDLQNPPEEIPLLIAALTDERDVVYAAPVRQQHGLLRDLASVMTKLVLQQAMGANNARNVSAFRLFRTSVRGAFHDFRGSYVSIDVLLTWGTTRFTVIRTRHDPRTIGKSNYTIAKLIAHAINMVTGFSVLPLQLASLVGFAFSIFGTAVLAYVLIRWIITGSRVPGFAFLASTVAIFSGAQLFALGIIGEYLARMHLRVMGRPSYTVRMSTGPANP